MPRVLLCDDQPDIRFLLEQVLLGEGYDVICEPGGREALARLEEDPLPDVVLLDVQMPGWSGWQTLDAIRAGARTADLPVILCTVKSGPVDQQRGLAAGCDGFVTKPFEPEDLVTAVRAALAGGRTAPA